MGNNNLTQVSQLSQNIIASGTVAGTVEELLCSLRTNGVELWLEETSEGLKPQLKGKPTEEQMLKIKQHRCALISLLLDEKRQERSLEEESTEGRRKVSEPCFSDAPGGQHQCLIP